MTEVPVLPIRFLNVPLKMPHVYPCFASGSPQRSRHRPLQDGDQPESRYPLSQLCGMDRCSATATLYVGIELLATEMNKAAMQLNSIVSSHGMLPRRYILNPSTCYSS